ncbi:hypothetical protein J6590_035522 [Homalodisca vitripennis]|nr:hypothetical protein J6590_035522 [Homalodisca vitripennis]
MHRRRIMYYTKFTGNNTNAYLIGTRQHRLPNTAQELIRITQYNGRAHKLRNTTDTSLPTQGTDTFHHFVSENDQWGLNERRPTNWDLMDVCIKITQPGLPRHAKTGLHH